MSFMKKVFGDPNERELKRLRPLVAAINDMEAIIEPMTDEELRSRTAEFREQLDQCADQDEQDTLLDEILPEAYAMVREAGKRALGQRHYDVQLIGGIVLHQGKIAEMGTGEGKTLAATLPSYLNALTGRGVHVVTVNDYLAQRDAERMGRLHRLLGLSVRAILSGPEHQDAQKKREAYHADITYGTNNEFGFDYLRDNMVVALETCVQRQLNYAIVDEVDNILIDEARTPLIISGPSMDLPEMYVRFAKVMPILKEGSDYAIDQKTRTVAITDEGIDKIEAALGIKNLYSDMMNTRYLENALRANAVMLRDRDYIVTNGEVIIIDEHTGRQMVGRRYNEGLHQAIEAKEKVRIQAENRTVATITFQNYFRLYRKLAGMTGTALTEAQEFDKIYKLDVMSIPTHRRMIRKDATDYIYKTESAKFDAVVEEIKACHMAGQPVLVGTTSVEKSELLAEKLDRAGLKDGYELLNAKNHLREAAIIAQAGRSGAITISTNMAGRGTDILLGGNPEGMVEQVLMEWEIDPDFATEEDRAEALTVAEQRCAEDHKLVVGLGGLHVIGTERHDSRRIDNQLRGRSGRQGDPGSTRFYVSLQDDLMRRFGADRVSAMMDRFGLEDDVPIESGMAAKMIEQAQTKVEAYYFDIRKNIVEYDDVIAKQREVIYRDRHDILADDAAFRRRASAAQERTVTEGEDDTELDEIEAPEITVHDRILTMLTEEVTELVQQYTNNGLPENWNLDALDELFTRWQIPLADDFYPENLNHLKRDQLINLCVEHVLAGYDAKRQKLDEQLAQLGEAGTTGELIMRSFERNVMLRVVDILWVDHIDALDVLRSGIGLRALAQRDPLVEFKNEAFSSFGHLKQQIRHFVAENVMLSQIELRAPEPVQTTPPPRQLQTNSDEIAAASGQSKTETIASALKSNEPKLKPKKPLTQTKALKQTTNDQANGANGRHIPRPAERNGHAAGPSNSPNGFTPPPTPLQSATEHLNSRDSEAAAAIVETTPTPPAPVGQSPAQAARASAAGQVASSNRPKAGPVNPTAASQSAPRPSTVKPTRTPTRPLNVANVGPNDPCPCGSKQKYKFCHGLGKK